MKNVIGGLLLNRMLREPDMGAGGGPGSGGVVSAAPAAPVVDAPEAALGAGGTDPETGDEAEQPPQPQKPAGKNVTLPQSAMKRIKQEERDRGRREAISSLAQELGFGTVEALKAAFARLKSGGNAAPAGDDMDSEGDLGLDADLDAGMDAAPVPPVKPAAKPPLPVVDNRKWEKQLAFAKQAQEALNRRLMAENKRSKDLQRALDAKEAEMSIREAAVSSGIKDIDYAVRLLTRKLEGADEATIASFDESQFFGSLRESHPYLFGETVKPATTGVGTGTNPPPPSAGATAQAQAKNGATDAKKMSKDEFNAHLAKRGLNIGM